MRGLMNPVTFRNFPKPLNSPCFSRLPCRVEHFTSSSVILFHLLSDILWLRSFPPRWKVSLLLTSYVLRKLIHRATASALLILFTIPDSPRSRVKAYCDCKQESFGKLQAYSCAPGSQMPPPSACMAACYLNPFIWNGSLRSFLCVGILCSLLLCWNPWFSDDENLSISLVRGSVMVSNDCQGWGDDSVVKVSCCSGG